MWQEIAQSLLHKCDHGDVLCLLSDAVLYFLYKIVITFFSRILYLGVDCLSERRSCVPLSVQRLRITPISF